jgi:nucleotide-binding universal stress UspA family protein
MVHVNFSRLLLAVDDSPVAAHAVDAGAGLARQLGAELALIHVIDPAETFAPDSGLPAAELLAMAKQEGRQLLARFRQRLPQDQAPPLEFLPAGKPASEIVKSAKEWPADMIVIGSHGRSGLERVLLGSVAESVLRHAPCSVLVIRRPE